ncbi:glycoside hydrolase family 28 protein [Pseudactinotalea terrae]|uniref:glycoside hydrolase family 28 protein n=1 Tax=Pseudactinotalea terrae TaxID=1743262 RepID=UPI0012E241F6|nr:glycosyl hydrolase family 28 protein [Pseudactinotalea terrae]
MSNHDITAYGARGDGRTDDAAAIQAAIDACHRAGGGRVIVPGGRIFRSGTIQLRSAVELHLETGATLAAHPDESAYTVRRATSGLTDGRPENDSQLSIMFILAEDCRDVAVTGTGTIDGGGRHFVVADLGEILQMRPVRPYTVFFRGCTGVRVSDLTIRDAAYWTLRLSGCADVVVRGVSIDNDLRLPNSDGIDIDTCQRVRISDCAIITGDDGICVKTCAESAVYGGCHDVVVTGCTITSRSSGLCIGSEVAAPIERCLFSSCVISDSNRGLALQLAEPGLVRDITFTDMVVQTRFCDERWWGHGEPIYISSYPWRGGSGTGRNIRFRHILARSENGVLIRSEEPGHLSGVLLEDVRVEIDRWSGRPGGDWDLRPHPSQGFVPHRTSGIHVERADDVTLRDCELVWLPPSEHRAEDMGPALTVVATAELRVRGLLGEAAHPDRDPAIDLDGRKLSVDELPPRVLSEEHV